MHNGGVIILGTKQFRIYSIFTLVVAVITFGWFYMINKDVKVLEENFKSALSIRLVDDDYVILLEDSKEIKVTDDKELLFKRFIRVVNDTHHEAELTDLLADTKSASIFIYVDESSDTLYYKLKNLGENPTTDYNSLIPNLSENTITYNIKGLKFDKNVLYISMDNNYVSLEKSEDFECIEIPLVEGETLDITIEALSNKTYLIGDITKCIKESSGNYTLDDAK